MGVTTYYSAGGELLGHRTDVGAAYGTDALGSVTVTAIDDQQRTPTNYYYKPYGSRLNKLGNNPDPKFQWVGTAGYRETAISHSKSYVRARHYGQEEGRWTTVDPLWPGEPEYNYVRNSPISNTDRFGLYLDTTTFGCDIEELCRGFPDPCNLINNCRPGTKCFKDILMCMAGSGFSNSDSLVRQVLNYMRGACQPKGLKGYPTICVTCNDTPRGWPTNCPNPCSGSDRYGQAILIEPGPVKSAPPGEAICTPVGQPCRSQLRKMGCDCVANLCPRNTGDVANSREHICLLTITHEMAHCSGLKGKPDHGDKGGPRDDAVFMISCCICRQLTIGDIRIPDPCGRCAK